MAMTKRAETSELSFTCPVIGPKDYVTKGPSGWPEAFRRKALDAKLLAFVKAISTQISIDDLVGVFIAKRELAEDPEPTSWFTVIGFIARQLDVEPRFVPHECGIAFWGQVVIAATTREVN